jgi:glucose/arabinose dehydrogenase
MVRDSKAGANRGGWKTCWARRRVITQVSFGASVALAAASVGLAVVLADRASFQTTPPSEPPSTTYGPSPKLPPPKVGEPPGINFATVIGWKSGETPKAPAGFEVGLFAGDLDNPRWLYVLPNGDVLVAESRTEKVGGELPPPILEGLKRAGLLGKSANRITLLRDLDGDGRAEVRETFAANLNLPFGMWLRGDHLYVANTDAVVRFRYRAGDAQVSDPGEKILDLPAGGYNNHWTRNIVGNADGSKIYVTVGSQTNVDEEKLDAKEPRRAAILEANADGSGMRLFATGLRNPNGMDWAPGTTTLWTVVNERDLLGDDLVPDYLTSVRDGAFYGWPYSYYGQHEDPRHKGARPDLVAKAVAPDYALGPHTASLGLHFYKGRAFPEAWRGAFIGQHGSWNRSSFSGYKVIHVPFRNGRPSGPPQDFLTGFIASPTTVRGRPVGVAELPDGSLLVADDAGNSVWRVRRIG